MDVGRLDLHLGGEFLGRAVPGGAEEDPQEDSPRRGHAPTVTTHQFERVLDASTFVAVTKTYGGNYTPEQFQAIEQIINREFGGVITKVEDAALYLSMRM